MNHDNNDMPSRDDGSPTRPLGFWLRAVDGLLTREFAAAFAQEDIGRREWMILNVLDGSVDAPPLTARIQRGKKLRPLIDRGWVEEADGSWRLTDAGREAKARLSTVVDGIRARVAGAVEPDAFAITLASLEAIARELGWDETQPMPFGPRGSGRRGRGFGPGFGREFGPGFRRGFGPGFRSDEPAPVDGYGPGGLGRGFGPHRFGPGFGPREMHGECGHPYDAHRGGHRGHGERRPERHTEHAYERGFDAGYRRAREDRDA
jgi:hypothetical protein